MITVGSIHQKTRQAYNAAAERYHNLFQNEMNEKEYDRHLLDSFSMLFEPGAMICDAGCGPSAHIGKYLWDKGMKITGVDISCYSVIHTPKRHINEIFTEFNRVLKTGGSLLVAVKVGAWERNNIKSV